MTPLRKLTEAVILQAAEDLWNSHNRRESIEFFTGEEFRWWATIAGMSPFEKLGFLGLINRALTDSRPVGAFLPVRREDKVR